MKKRAILLCSLLALGSAAIAHAYEEFDTSETDSRASHVLYDQGARSHAKGWDGRDKAMIEYAVQQERLRLAN